MENFVFPLQQHIGAPAEVVVKEGDLVKRGQLLAAKPADKMGSNIFTSVSGKVTAVTDKAVTVEPAAEQSKEYIRLTQSEPLALIEEAGLVGLGGAGFPTYVKLGQKLRPGGVVIANASECEPILSHNIEAIEKNPQQLIRGLEIVMEVVGAPKGVIAIKDIHEEAAKALEANLKDSRITLHYLPNIYPVGDERAIVREVLDTLLDVTALPSAANAIVINAESVCRVQEAVDLKKPLIDKDMTVAGKINGELIQVFHDVPLGISVRAMIEKAGGINGEYGEIIMGRPFMGKRVTLDDPVVKTTGGILVTQEFMRGPKKIGLLVCACGANQQRLEQIAASMGAEVTDVEFCKQAKLMKNGTRKCENPGHCPGQVQKVMAIKKSGADAILISNCSDCSNTVMSCAPQLKLPVYHCTDGALRAVNHKLIRRMKG
mgnify:FL=1